MRPGSVPRIAKAAELNKTQLYRAFSENGILNYVAFNAISTYNGASPFSTTRWPRTWITLHIAVRSAGKATR